jgi:hypothetical protein
LVRHTFTVCLWKTEYSLPKRLNTGSFSKYCC